MTLPESRQVDTAGRGHQPDEGRFHAIRQDEIEWRTLAAYPPGVRMAVLVGDPGKPGPM
jgi:hypothetical protein